MSQPKRELTLADIEQAVGKGKECAVSLDEWYEEFIRQSDETTRRVLCEVRSHKNYGTIVIDATSNYASHHRSCALRGGGKECTC